MELVYLWVEKYKNIEKQGFNLSPKFRCKYNPETNELKIEENPNYVSIFPDNINITAIVGKNGSGKSNLLEFILNQKDFNGFFVFFCNDFLYILNNFKIKNINNKTRLLVNNIRNDFILNCQIFNNLIFIKTFVDINKYKFNAQNYLLPRFFFKKTEKIDVISDLHKSSVELWNIFKINSKKGINDNWDIEPFSSMILDHYFLYLKERFYNIILLNYIELYPIIKKYFKINRIEFALKSLGDIFFASPYFKDNYKKDYFLNLAFELYNKEKLDKKKLLILFLIFSYLFNENLRKEITIYLKSNNNFSIDDLCESLFQKFDNEYVNLWKEFVNNYVQYQSFENFIEIYLKLKKNIRHNILQFSFEPFLSTGEEKFIYIISNIFNTIKEFEKVGFNKNILLILDEPDLFLHSTWQKEFVKIIIDFLNQYWSKYNFQIIIATHSPFIISDLPKENIIFLDKDENGKCKVVDGLNEKKETFGANIHTLLSDSFFMEDGLMGEFAKSKINEIINFHNKIKENIKNESLENEIKFYEENKDKFWNIQRITGEEYLKQVIKNYLIEIEKLLFGKDRAKEEEIKRLQKEIERLKNND